MTDDEESWGTRIIVDWRRDKIGWRRKIVSSEKDEGQFRGGI